jgi:hypothetical protein
MRLRLDLMCMMRFNACFPSEQPASGSSICTYEVASTTWLSASLRVLRLLLLTDSRAKRCASSGWPNARKHCAAWRCSPRCCGGWLSGPGSGAGGCWPASSIASRRVWWAAASPAPHPSPRRWPTATPWSCKRWRRASPARPVPPATPRARPCWASTRRRPSCCWASSAT